MHPAALKILLLLLLVPVQSLVNLMPTSLCLLTTSVCPVGSWFGIPLYCRGSKLVREPATGSCKPEHDPLSANTRLRSHPAVPTCQCLFPQHGKSISVCVCPPLYLTMTIPPHPRPHRFVCVNMCSTDRRVLSPLPPRGSAYPLSGCPLCSDDLDRKRHKICRCRLTFVLLPASSFPGSAFIFQHRRKMIPTDLFPRCCL